MFTRLKRVIAIILTALFCGLASPAGAYSDKPEDVYLEGYLSFNRGQELVEQESKFEALMKLREAKERFDYVWRTWPSWQPQMLDYRRKKVHELVAKLEIELKQAEIAGGAQFPKPIDPVDPGDRRPPLDNPMDELADRFRRLEEENRRQKQYLADKDQQLEQARRDRDSAQRAQSQLQVRLTELEGTTKMSVGAAERLGDAQRAATAAEARERAANRLVVSLQEKLNSVEGEQRAQFEAELAAAKQTATEAQSDRAKLEGQVVALGGELKIARAAAEQAQGLLGAAQREARDMQSAMGEATERTESLTREVEELKRIIAEGEKNRARMKAFGEGGGPSDAVIEDLMGDLDRKNRELAEAKGQILDLTEEVAKLRRENKTIAGKNADLLAKLQQRDELLKLKTEEIQGLKKELESVNAEISRLREENANYKIQVAEFQKELKKAAANLTQAMQKPSDDLPAEVMVENKLMRGQIIRMMRGQALRMQQKELIIKELTKYGANSAKLLDTVELLTNETAVTEDVIEMIQNHPIENLGDGRAEAIMATPGNPSGGSDGFPELPPFDPESGIPGGSDSGTGVRPAAGGLQQLLESAGEACKAGQFAESETAYQDYLRADPDNATALANLGLVKMNLGKNREADQYLRKALTLQPGDPFSLFVLGVNAYEERQLDIAKEALAGCVQVDPKNAQAYHYLGVIAIDQDQRDLAVDQFRRAVEIDPSYGTAHYNLSVLYATGSGPDLENARRHYEFALTNGSEKDPAMDKLLY